MNIYELAKLQSRISELEAQLAKVRRRVIYDYYMGTSPDAAHWWMKEV